VLARGAYIDYSVFNVNVAVGRGGHAALVWEEYEPEGRWRATYRTPQGDWSRRVTLPRMGYRCCVQVAVDARGVATFLYNKPRKLILQQRTPRRWLPPVTLATNLDQRAAHDVDAAAPGKFVVTWKSRDNAIHAGVYDAGTWTEDAGLVKNPGLPRVAELSVDATAHGAAFVWIDRDPGVLYATYRDPDTAVDPGTRPAVALAEKVWLPRVAHDSLGASIAWTGPNRRVFISRHDYTTNAADAWAEPIEVTKSRTVGYSQLAMSASPKKPTTTILWNGPHSYEVSARRITAIAP